MIKITNEDNMDLMARYPDKFFDLAIVDPPYGIGWGGENLTMSKGIRKDGSIRADSSWRAKNYEQKYKTKNWDDKKPEKSYFEELFRVSKNQVIWGGNYFELPLTGGWIVWDKKKPQDFSLSQGELAWYSMGQSLRIFSWLWHGYGQEDMKNKEERFHPTQKPVALYKWLLTKYAKPGQTILDTHLGSGSIAIACHDLVFDLTACELDKDYFEAAVKRLKEHQAQATLFDPVELTKETQGDLF